MPLEQPVSHQQSDEREPLVAHTAPGAMAANGATKDAVKLHAVERVDSYHDSPRGSSADAGDAAAAAGPGHDADADAPQHHLLNGDEPDLPPVYRVYRRRFLGLVQITLLNIAVSWNWLTYAPVSASSSAYFGVGEDAINWLSTGFLFAFVAATPAAVWMLNRSVKGALVTAAVLMTAGTWIRYAGTRGGHGHGTFGVAVLGQMVVGLGQPFVLAAPTRYSDVWFSEAGRISATAVASLANPFGGALINPFWVGSPHDVPNMVLYIAIITTLISIPTAFLPARPPTPPTPTAGVMSEVHVSAAVLRRMLANPSFHLIAWPLMVYTSAFNATSTLLNQIFEPYGFSEDDAGIAGALLIVVGLVSAAVSSPLLDRFRALRLPIIKLLVPFAAAMYTALIYVPGSGSMAGPYVVCAILGAASFSLMPLALELLVDVTWGDAGPEVSSTLCWAGGQLGGAILIIVMTALKGADGQPAGSLRRALVLQTVFVWMAVPLALALGYWGTGRAKRLEHAF